MVLFPSCHSSIFFLIVCFVCLTTKIQIQIHIQRSFPRPPSEWWALKLAQITPCRKVEVLDTKWIITLGCRLCIGSWIPYRLLLQADSQFGMWLCEWLWRSTWWWPPGLSLHRVWTLPLHMWICLTAHTHTPAGAWGEQKGRGMFGILGLFKTKQFRCSLSSASYLFAVMGVDFWETPCSSTLTTAILSTMVQRWILITYA